MGRQTKYRPEYGQLLLDEMKTGKSLTQCATVLNISLKTLYNWAEEYPEFKDYMERAMEAAQSFYETTLQGYATDPEFKATAAAKMLELLLTARFKKDYTRASVQHQEITVNHVAKMSEDQLDEQITRLLGNSGLQQTINLTDQEYSTVTEEDTGLEQSND